jgi:hypothetical protein
VANEGRRLVWAARQPITPPRCRASHGQVDWTASPPRIRLCSKVAGFSLATHTPKYVFATPLCEQHAREYIEAHPDRVADMRQGHWWVRYGGAHEP